MSTHAQVWPGPALHPNWWYLWPGCSVVSPVPGSDQWCLLSLWSVCCLPSLCSTNHHLATSKCTHNLSQAEYHQANTGQLPCVECSTDNMVHSHHLTTAPVYTRIIWDHSTQCIKQTQSPHITQVDMIQPWAVVPLVTHTHMSTVVTSVQPAWSPPPLTHSSPGN